MKNTTQEIVISSMFAALVCVTTMLIKIPSPLRGISISGTVSCVLRRGYCLCRMVWLPQDLVLHLPISFLDMLYMPRNLYPKSVDGSSGIFVL